MSSRLPQKFGVDYVGLNGLAMPENVRLWLKQFMEQWERVYFILREDATANSIVNNIVSNNYTGRSARVQSVGASAVSVKLLDVNGQETGAAFDVTPVTVLGVGSTLSDKYPSDLLVGKDVPVFIDIDGKWKTTQPFDSQYPDCGT